jgi:hypothetical protein
MAQTEAAEAPMMVPHERFTSIRLLFGCFYAIGILAILAGIPIVVVGSLIDNPGWATPLAGMEIIASAFWFWFLASALYLLLRIEANTAGRKWEQFGTAD